jgi:hypothetical protein
VHPILGSLADGVCEQHEAHRFIASRGIATRLVIRLDSREPEAVPGGDRSIVELEEPEAKPALLKSDRGEVPMEPFPAKEGRARLAPPCDMKRKQDAEVVLQAG